MKQHPLKYLEDYLSEIDSTYLEDIKGDQKQSFTRKRKITLKQLFLQMLSNRGLSQKKEIMHFYNSLNTNITTSSIAFYKARMKIDPLAILKIQQDYISDIYYYEKQSLKSLKGYYIMAVDGSDIVLPTSNENELIFGKNAHAKTEIQAVSGKLSLLYDCLNKIILDTKIGRFRHSELDLASKHLESKNEILSKRDKTIVIFDRNYFSYSFVTQMIDNNQKFIIRLTDKILRSYVEQTKIGEDKTYEINRNTHQTAKYIKDKVLRYKLLSGYYKLRICRFIVGENLIETLVTNIPENEFNIDELKYLYHLRWNIETAYNTLKQRMKFEEFSGKRERLIRQDIYCSIWVYNIIMLLANEIEIDERRYKHEMSINVNMAIGIFKEYFIKIILSKDKKELIEEMKKLMKRFIVPIRPFRQFKRKTVINNSRVSYRYSY